MCGCVYAYRSDYQLGLRETNCNKLADPVQILSSSACYVMWALLTNKLTLRYTRANCNVIQRFMFIPISYRYQEAGITCRFLFYSRDDLCEVRKCYFAHVVYYCALTMNYDP